MNSKQEKEYLTVRQVVQMLQVNEETVRRRIADKTLLVVRIGGVQRVRRSDLENVLRGEGDAAPTTL